MKPPRRALTTGQAAKVCFVTADTIANWIRSGLLHAQRTAGGQYRILAGDLRDFMVARGMSTDALEPETEARPQCWTFWAAEGTAPALCTTCDECIVRYLKVLDCFKLMAMRPPEDRPVRDCVQCKYFQRYGIEADDSVET